METKIGKGASWLDGDSSEYELALLNFSQSKIIIEPLFMELAVTDTEILALNLLIYS